MPLGLAAPGVFPGHLQAGIAGQVFHGGGKVQSVVLHDEANGIAAGTAAEAVVKLLVRVDRERGGFFLVEGAQPLVIAAGALQLHPGINDFYDIDPIE